MVLKSDIMQEPIKQTEFLNFWLIKDTGKTLNIGISNKSGDKLGVIVWYAPWRRYVFSPMEEKLFFDSKCLKDIVGYIDDLMAERKKKK